MAGDEIRRAASKIRATVFNSSKRTNSSADSGKSNAVNLRGKTNDGTDLKFEHGRFNPLTAVVQDGAVNPESAGLSESSQRSVI